MTDDRNAEYQRKSRARRRPGPEPATTTRQFQARPFWQQFASCRPEYADRPLDEWVDLFFPSRGESSREAKEICAECPAKAACAEHALVTNERFGVWGGSSERDRRRRRRENRLTA